MKILKKTYPCVVASIWKI